MAMKWDSACLLTKWTKRQPSILISGYLHETLVFKLQICTKGKRRHYTQRRDSQLFVSMTHKQRVKDGCAAFVCYVFTSSMSFSTRYLACVNWWRNSPAGQVEFAPTQSLTTLTRSSPSSSHTHVSLGLAFKDSYLIRASSEGNLRRRQGKDDGDVQMQIWWGVMEVWLGWRRRRGSLLREVAAGCLVGDEWTSASARSRWWEDLDQLDLDGASHDLTGIGGSRSCRSE